jgi:radical SAM superfamily enzyme YgiQ (UPF0313 family)
MARYVLVSDTTLSREYSNFPLLDYLPCAPSDVLPKSLYNFLRGSPPRIPDGRARTAPYALRKIESALLQKNGKEDIIVAHENHIGQFVHENTEIVGVYTMDPLGLGPLTMSYAVLFGTDSPPWVKLEFEGLMRKIRLATKGKKAKVVVVGPGVWELTILPEVMEQLGIDLAFQGEADDIINELLEDISTGAINSHDYYQGFQSFDQDYHKVWVGYDKFITRKQLSKQYPTLEEIPLIQNPSVKGIAEVMRGCGIGCDFCEVTLRPLRYYDPEDVKKEVAVNVAGGYSHVWIHSDEIFAYQHGPHYVPNGDAIKELFNAIMSVKGVEHCNPTHGRISIPAAYPELIKELSDIFKAGPDFWVGMQVGIETGSEKLALEHMPNKTLPLRIGTDAPWQQIVIDGTRNLNKYYWRPAFTVQVGQAGEAPEDNWDTVALVNKLSNMEVDGRPSEFTITPMQNVPLGLIKTKRFSPSLLDESQLAVYYACYRHLAKIARRDSFRDASGNIARRAMVASMIYIGSIGFLRIVENICKKKGVDVEMVKRHGLEPQQTVLARA